MHVHVRVGQEAYALPVADVRSVIELEGITPLFGAPPSVLGVRAFEGVLLPVFDLACALGIEPTTPQRVLVIAHGDRQVGFAVEQVLDVAELPVADEAPASRQLRGMVLVDGQLVGVLDVAAVFADLETELTP